jgi:hypothetical protein
MGETNLIVLEIENNAARLSLIKPAQLKLMSKPVSGRRDVRITDSQNLVDI